MSDASIPAGGARDIAKTRRASSHPDRPGEDCKAPSGSWKPAVDHARCEGKRDCVAVCPFDVFEVRTIDPLDYTALPFLARMKVRAHGRMTAYTPNAEACHACGLCVVACPEHAIKLVRSDTFAKESGEHLESGGERVEADAGRKPR